MQGKDGKNFFLRLKESLLSDKILLSAFILIVIFGAVIQFSANYPDNMNIFRRHLMYLVISLFFFILSLLIPLKFYYTISPFFYAICLFLLIFLLKKGPGVKRWLKISNFQFQPSEIAKLSLILIFGKIVFMKNLRKEITLIIILTLIFLWLIVIQPDLGTSIVVLGITLGAIFSMEIDMPIFFLIVSPILCILSSFNIFTAIIFFGFLLLALYLSKVNLGLSIFLIFMNIFIGALTPVFIHFLKPYQKARIMVFLNPYKDPSGSGWHILQSKISIGSGGIFGKGLLNGTLKSLKFIPMKNTDFVFSVIGEELGFLGTLFTFILFFILLYRLMDLIYRSKGSFSKIVSAGIFFYFFLHIFINIGMCLGVLPVVGLPLPFISYGGTNLLVSSILIGIAFNIKKNIYEYF